MARDDRKRPPRTPPERSGMAVCPRDERGRLQRVDALERFRAKCRFDPVTGCVIWIGGKTQGRGHSAWYGSFWYDGRREFAHRWAAVHIHGLNIDGITVGHCCPHTPDGHPNTLCVQHLVAQTLAENVAECNTRTKTKPVVQSATQLQFWAFVNKGLEPAPASHDPASVTADDVPFHSPPAWLTPGRQLEESECPF